MVKPVPGILITWYFLRSDEAIKQLLKSLNDTHKFIIKDLGETKLFVRADAQGLINVLPTQEEVKKFQDQNTYVKPKDS